MACDCATLSLSVWTDTSTWWKLVTTTSWMMSGAGPSFIFVLFFCRFYNSTLAVVSPPATRSSVELFISGAAANRLVIRGMSLVEQSPNSRPGLRGTLAHNAPLSLPPTIPLRAGNKWEITRTWLHWIIEAVLQEQRPASDLIKRAQETIRALQEVREGDSTRHK